MSTTDPNWVRATLELLILKSLMWGPRHGYGVSQWIDRATDGGLLLEEGTLYPALHRLEKNAWIDSSWGRSENNRRAKFYTLTPRGQRRLERESEGWRSYVAAVERALATAQPEPA